MTTPSDRNPKLQDPQLGSTSDDTEVTGASATREPAPDTGNAPDDEQHDGDGDEQHDGDGDESGDSSAADPRRAAFLDDLPDSPELQPLIAAFVAGNYAVLREQELALRAQSKDPDVLAAARELVERTEPDPLSKALLGFAVLFFLFLVAWVYLHHGQ